MADKNETEEVVVPEEEEKTVELNTHEKINRQLSGELVLLNEGHAVVVLETNEDMLADSAGLIHGGFIFSAADFAAMAAVNEKNVVLAASSCQFLAPVRLNDEIRFEARVRHKEGRKRNVNVTGYVHEIKVFDAEFKTVVTEYHVLRLHLLDNVEQMQKR